MTKEFAARRLDVKAFAEAGARTEGKEPLRSFPRLLAETFGSESPAGVSWSAQGELRNPLHVNPEVWLHLEAQAPLTLTCQRCLGPVETEVSVERMFRFAPDEDTAAAQDEEADEDVLALDRAFDLLGLVEDELLMEMPLAPRHDVCPQPVAMEAVDKGFDGDSAVRENPFAVLGKLKGGKS